MTMTAIAPSATGTDTAAALKEIRKAEAYANTGRLEEARRTLARAISLDRRSQPAIALSRLLQDPSHGAGPAAETNCYTLLLEAKWTKGTDPHDGSAGFFTVYHVAADTTDEALGLCRAFEPRVPSVGHADQRDRRDGQARDEQGRASGRPLPSLRPRPA